MSITIFGWLRDDGTVAWDRDEVVGHMRRVVQGFKNSDAFLKSVDRELDKQFPKSVRQKEAKE